jgi:hypothetical protein
MATLGSQGLVDDGSDDLTVRGTTTLGPVLNRALTLAPSGSVTITNPGFYYLAATGSSGEGYFTGTVPAPSSCPGSMLMITDTFGVFNWLLTGSAYRYGKALFVKMSGSNPGVVGGTGYGGGTVNLSPSGSIQMISDGFRWCIIGGSGSAALAGLNL